MIQYKMEPPIAERHVKEVLFGVEKGKNKGSSKFLMNPPLKKKDYYYWLRDDNRKNKKVLKYLEEENDYANYIFSKGLNLEKSRILSELRKNMVEDYDTIKLPRGQLGLNSPYRFFKRYEKGCSYPIYYYNVNEKDVKYLDPNDFKNKVNNISDPEFSPLLTKVVYGIDYNGDENYDIKILNFPELVEISHKLPKILYSNFVITEHYIFYLESDHSNRPFKLIKYTIDTKETELIYQEDNIEKEIELEMGEDYKYIKYSIGNYSENEIKIYWFDGPNIGKDIVVKKLIKNVDYEVVVYGDYFIIKTNENKCDNYCLKYCKIGKKRWFNLIKYDRDVYIEDINVVKNGLLLNCRKNGESFFSFLKLDRINVIGENIIRKKKGGYSLDLYYCNFGDNRFIYSYDDFITPLTWYEYDLSKNSNSFIMQKKVKNYDKNKYKVERKIIKHKNIKIPIDILMPKDYKGNGKCLLYGYNSYGSNVDITFNEKLFPLIDRGFIYAIANTRGSSYMGMNYYKDGMMLNKMNTFKDFIKVSEYLIKNKYCSKNGLSIEGRSAGGLLVSAVSIMRPDLYKNVLAGVPFVDVLTTMSDSTIPLTNSEWVQWGNPNIRKYYNYMSKYSPIDNIKSGICYPNYFIQAGLNDPRVAYWEPAKFVATLRYNEGKNCNNIIVMKTDMDKGHFGSWDRYGYLEEIAERYAFIIKNG